VGDASQHAARHFEKDVSGNVRFVMANSGYNRQFSVENVKESHSQGDVAWYEEP
jgi:hypothetical protein